MWSEQNRKFVASLIVMAEIYGLNPDSPDSDILLEFTASTFTISDDINIESGKNGQLHAFLQGYLF